MATKNDVTGDTIQSKMPSKAYTDNWDAIFGKKKEKVSDENDVKQKENNKISS